MKERGHKIVFAVRLGELQGLWDHCYPVDCLCLHVCLHNHMAVPTLGWCVRSWLRRLNHFSVTLSESL